MRHRRGKGMAAGHWRSKLAATIFVVLALGLSQSADAKTDQLSSLCNVIANGLEADLDSRHTYVFEDIIADAAGVTNKDSKESARAKILLLWHDRVRSIYCSNTGFSGGSPLKYAIFSRFEGFIYRVLRDWRVPPEDLGLNSSDKITGLTNLDYVDEELRRPNSHQVQQDLQKYKSWLVSAGARRRVDIDGVDCGPAYRDYRVNIRGCGS